MRNKESHSDNNSADRTAKSRIEERFREAGIDIERFIGVHPGTKIPAQKWRDDGLGRHPDNVDGNYGIKCGDGLIVLDIDEPGKEPDDLPETLGVETPHGNPGRRHLYYQTEEKIGSGDTECGELQGVGSIVIGPDSIIDHEDYCDDDKQDCPGEGTGEYILDDKPIATLSDEGLEAIGEAGTTETETQASDHDPVADPDSELVDQGEISLHTLQSISTPAFNDILNFLQGGIPGLDDEDDDRYESEKMFKEDGRIDRDSHDTVALSLLYGALCDYCDHDHEEAIDIATATYTHYCHEHPWTEDGQKRRWGYEGTEYRRHTITYALNSFDSERFKQLVEKRGAGTRDEDNKYSELTYDAIWAALYDLLPDNPPQTSR